MLWMDCVFVFHVLTQSSVLEPYWTFTCKLRVFLKCAAFGVFGRAFFDFLKPKNEQSHREMKTDKVCMLVHAIFAAENINFLLKYISIRTTSSSNNGVPCFGLFKKFYHFTHFVLQNNFSVSSMPRCRYFHYRRAGMLRLYESHCNMLTCSSQQR